MNKLHDCFDPSLRPVFSKAAYAAASSYPQDSRHLFYTLVHISEHYDALPLAYHYINEHLLDINGHYQANFSKEYHADKISFEFDAPGNVAGLPDENLKAYLLQSAPIILTEPYWLQAVSQAATSQSPLAVRLLSVYLKLTDGVKYKSSYQALCLASGLDIPALHTWAFAKHEEIDGCMFDLAALQLALAQFPRVFFAELLGFTLAFCQSRTLAAQFSTVQANDSRHFITERQKLLDSQAAALIETIKDYLNLYVDQADTLWQRIQTGAWLYQKQIERCCRQLTLQSETTLSCEQALAKLFQQKAAFAFGHHRKIQLAGKSLDDWFSESPFDSKNFLVALKQSPFIDSQNPAESRLLKLFEFNGPMFGVLNAAEQEILKAWVGSEKTAVPEQHKPEIITTEAEDLLDVDENRVSSINYSRLNNRECYYYLVNAELFPEVLSVAKKRVDNVLHLSKLLNRLPFKLYRHPVFEGYVDALYQREVNAYQPLKGKPKLSKQAYLWGIEQFAPAILADGCWLQAVRQLSLHSNHAIGEILFNIYCDELGNGLLEQNHPYIYQQLLDSIGIKLPPIHDQKFSQHPGFIDSSFDIPVYVLAISRFPSTFLPELLGLNMAIELSGLGKDYLRLSEELKFWGINPKIVDIHTSIDNLASGHAALAKQAIQLHLDEISACYGEQEMQRHWRRIYNGFCSLQAAGSRLKIALVTRYFMKKVTDFYATKST